MHHKPIIINDLCLSFPNKLCFEGFTDQIYSGDRIAIIGPNGAGKSILLKIMQGEFTASSGSIDVSNDITFGYVPQTIDEFRNLSGGQRFQKALTHALALDPNVLLLDEPTNHLDRSHRLRLLHLLGRFQGTLILVSHDVEVLRQCVNSIWHIGEGKVHVFSGHYNDYLTKINMDRVLIEKQRDILKQQKNHTHKLLMKEQVRAKKSKAFGEKKYANIRCTAHQQQGLMTTNKKNKSLAATRENLTHEHLKFHLPKIIVPHFSLSASDARDGALLSIVSGTVGYPDLLPLVDNINLMLGSTERIAIVGHNGCGKSTLIKAILNDPNITRTGHWQAPKLKDIGYLDQHYATLLPDVTVFDTIAELVPTWTQAEVRSLLRDFLFRSNEEVNTSCRILSGGERARLSLAQIAAVPPKLLILDELTNNLDIETKEQVVHVLRFFPGAMIIISHEDDFLKQIGIEDAYVIGEEKNYAKKFCSFLSFKHTHLAKI